ncbi:MAG: hypothetical protein JW394_0640 [Nitrospira sp.]|nr:hypothetical protein [Nitrospira sp.]
MLYMHVVDAERFAPIVNRAATGTIRIGQRVALWEKVALLVQRTERFVTDFMINYNKLPKVRAGSVLNHDLPTTRSGREIA